MTTKTTSQYLRDVRALIDTPEKWVKGFYAANADGRPVRPNDPAACKFCIRGAMDRVTSGLECSASRKVLDAVRDCLDDAGHASKMIHVFNDWGRTTHTKVMSLLDNAIARAEKEEANAH
jgi:hypothetical protein